MTRVYVYTAIAWMLDLLRVKHRYWRRAGGIVAANTRALNRAAKSVEAA